jgi:cardiolipin synthase
MTMDGQWCVIGSSNWDTRSLRLNFEFDLECYDPALTRTLEELIDGRIAQGKPWAPDMLVAQPVWLRLRDAAARLLMPYL